MMEPTYRRVEMPPEPWTHEDNPEWIFVESHPEPYMLVPDTRLQAIADAWKKYRNPIDQEDEMDWWKELVLTLDALTQEDTPCPACNDEGILHTHEGDIIGPCTECALTQEDTDD